MEYKEFRSKVIAEFIRYLPEKYSKGNIETHVVNKVNGSLEGLCISDEEIGRSVPIVFIENLYDHYKGCMDFDKVMNLAARGYIDSMEKAVEISKKIDPKDARNNIIMTVVNTEKNKELIANAPSRNFMDLTIIYRWIIGKGDTYLNGIIVTDKVAKNIGMDEDELYLAALENTEKVLPAKLMFMSDSFCILTNNVCINGAATMLYKDLLQKVADKMKSDLYVIPSSIHEVIAIPTTSFTVNEIENMIQDANNTVVESNEILSDNPYFFNRESQSLDLARKVCCN